MTVNQITQDKWTTSESVQDKVRVQQNGDPPNVDGVIDSATDTVQTWVMGAIGSADKEDLPDPSLERHELLATATAYQAASEFHEKEAAQTQSDDGTPKHVFLESRADSKFQNWKDRRDLKRQSKDRQSESVSGSSSAKSGSLIDLADRQKVSRHRARRY